MNDNAIQSMPSNPKPKKVNVQTSIIRSVLSVIISINTPTNNVTAIAEKYDKIISIE